MKVSVESILLQLLKGHLHVTLPKNWEVCSSLYMKLLKMIALWPFVVVHNCAFYIKNNY